MSVVYIIAKFVRCAHRQLTSSQSPSPLYAAFIVVCLCPSADEWNRTLAPAQAHALGHNCRIVRAATVIQRLLVLCYQSRRKRNTVLHTIPLHVACKNIVTNPNVFPFNISSRLSSEHFLYFKHYKWCWHLNTFQREVKNSMIFNEKMFHWVWERYKRSARPHLKFVTKLQRTYVILYHC